jgi:hypothetical protein
MPLATGKLFTYDGLTHPSSTCAYTLNGTAQTRCASDDAALVETGTGGAARFELESRLSSTAPVFSLATGGDGTANDDLSFNLQVTAASTHSPLGSLAGCKVDGRTSATSCAGAAGKAHLSNITRGLSATLPSGISSAVIPSNGQVSSTQLTINAGGPALAAMTYSPDFNPTSASPLGLNVAVKLASGPAASAGDTVLLSKLIYAVSSDPEPAFIAIMAMGLTGLAVCRRRSKQQRSFAKSIRSGGVG